MVLFILTAGMTGTNHNRKYYWVILSHALAAGGAYAATRKTWNPVPCPETQRLQFQAMSRFGIDRGSSDLHAPPAARDKNPACKIFLNR